MLTRNELFRQVLARPQVTLAANIFDPLSARIANVAGYEVCVLSGSVGKVANLAVPDIVMSNMSDVVDHCRRIQRISDLPLMVDAEDGFGNAVNVMRTIREMEQAGVSGVEIEDNYVPKRFGVETPGLVSQGEQVGKLRAAVAARSDPTTVVVARTAALGECPLDEALDRVRAYSATGVEALMLTGAPTREQIQAVHGVTSLPLAVLSPPPDARNDDRFLAENGVRILMLGNPTFEVAVRSIYDALTFLKTGGNLEDLKEKQAPGDLLRRVNRADDFIAAQRAYYWGPT